MHHLADGLLRPGLLAAACTLSLAACQAQPDLSAVRAQAERPLQRYHVIQTLNANQQVVIAGTQAGSMLVSTDAGHSWQRTSVDGASLIDSAQCPDGSFVALDFYRRVVSISVDGAVAASSAFEEPSVPLAIACDPRGGWWVAGTCRHCALARSGPYLVSPRSRRGRADHCLAVRR